MTRIMVQPGFSTAAECAELVNEIRRVTTLDPNARITPARTELLAASLRTHGGVTVDVIRSRVLAELARFYAVEDLRLECTLLSEMHAGDSHPLHADNERRAEDGWEPNHTPFRSHAAILYLNASGADYSGGTLHFPTRAVEVVPAAGTLVAFPCGREFEHEVNVVSAGTRYTFAFWCTTHPDHEEPWS